MNAEIKKQQRELQLREAAEAKLEQPPSAGAGLRPADELLHELQVHQVELEMQNEALRKAQLALEDSRDRYVDLYEYAPIGYLTLTAGGLIAAINLTGAALLGTEHARLLQRPFASRVSARDLDRWTQHYQRLERHGGHESLELSLQRGDGTEFEAQLDCEFQIVGDGDTASRHEASVGGIRMVLSDISARKRAEYELQQHRNHLEELVFARTAELAQARDAAEAANRAKTTFLSNMSHELRTPMTGIMGMTDLVLMSADPRQKERLAKVMSSSKRLLALINDLIDFAALESERVVLKEQNFSLAHVIDDSLHGQEEAAQAKGLQLSQDLAPELPGIVCGDAVRLRQILSNYIGNAVKFSARGYIAVRAQLLAEDSHSLLLRLSVSDQGIGLSPAEQALLFQAFVQIDGSSTRNYEGTGLGLALCRRIARLMGGETGVTSTVGVGSTFWATVRLRRATAGLEAAPVAITPDAPAEPVAESLENLQRLFSGARVLVATDDVLKRELLVFLLEDAGLVPEVTGSGREAVERAGTGGYALIVMDMQLPLTDGLDACRAIRALPGMAALPVLALDADARSDDLERCLAAGMNDHIDWPANLDAIHATLLHWLRKQAAAK